MPDKWSPTFLKRSNVDPKLGPADRQLYKLLEPVYAADEYIHLKQQYLNSIMPYLIELSRSDRNATIPIYLSVHESTGTALLNAGLTFRDELFEVVRHLEVKEPVVQSSWNASEWAVARMNRELALRCAYYYDAEQDWHTPPTINRFTEALQVVVAHGLDCMLINSKSPPEDAQSGSLRHDTNHSGAWVRLHATNKTMYGNRDQLYFAVHAPLLITRPMTTWTDYPIMKRSQMGLPSAIMHPHFGSGPGPRNRPPGPYRWQPPLSKALDRHLTKTSIAPHLLCNTTADGKMPCASCVFVRGSCIEADLYRGEEWERDKCAGFQQGFNCLGLDMRDVRHRTSYFCSHDPPSAPALRVLVPNKTMNTPQVGVA